MATGHSGEIISQCNRVNNTLKMAEMSIRGNLSFFIEHIKEHSKQPIGRILRFVLVSENKKFYVIDELSLLLCLK